MSYRETLSSLGVCVTFELSYTYVFLSMFTVYHFSGLLQSVCTVLVLCMWGVNCIVRVWSLLLGFLTCEVCSV